MICKLIGGVLIRAGRLVSEEAWRERVGPVSTAAMVAALDKAGVRHCADCPQTEGLANFAGRAYCRSHGVKPQPEQRREGDKRGKEKKARLREKR